MKKKWFVGLVFVLMCAACAGPTTTHHGNSKQILVVTLQDGTQQEFQGVEYVRTIRGELSLHRATMTNYTIKVFNAGTWASYEWVEVAETLPAEKES